MKKLLSLILSIMVMSQTLAYAKQDIITVEDAVKTAISIDKQIGINKYEKDILEKAFVEELEDADDIDIDQLEREQFSLPMPNYTMLISMRDQKYLNPMKTQTKISIKQKQNKIYETNLKYSAYKTYYDLVYAKKELELSNDKYALDLKKFKNGKLKYDQGLISKNDLSVLEYQKDITSWSVKLAKNNMQSAIYNLNKYLGNKYQDELKVDMNLEYQAIDEFDIEDAIDNAIKHRMEVSKADNELHLKQIALANVDAYFDEDDPKYDEAQLYVDQEKINVETIKRDIEYEIRTTYNNLLNLLDIIKINEKQVFVESIFYKVAQLKFKLKMITSAQLNESKIKHDDAKLKLDKAIIDYKTTKYKFQQVDLGPGSKSTF